MSRPKSGSYYGFKLVHARVLLPVLFSFAFWHSVIQAQERPKDVLDQGKVRIAFSSCRSGIWQIWAVPFEGGNPEQLTQLAADAGYPAWSPDGKKLAFADNEGRIWTMELGKAPQPVRNTPVNSNHPAWSPDSTRIAFVAYSFSPGREDSDIWVADLIRGEVRKLMEQPGIQEYPAWSPDGSQILYSTGYRVNSSKVVEDIWVVGIDGKGPKLLLSNGCSNIQPDWSADGARIAFASDKSGNMDIWTMDKAGKNLSQWTRDRAYDGDPSWSPDGDSLAFVSTRKGRMEIWIMGHGEKGERRLMEGAAESKEPCWAGVIVHH